MLLLVEGVNVKCWPVRLVTCFLTVLGDSGLTCGMLTRTLVFGTLATLMRPCWMILWPCTWTLGTEALGASSRGGGPDPECCCCCCRRDAICWGDTAMG
jgi:hypothetical protein